MLSPLLGSCAVLGAYVASDGSSGPARAPQQLNVQFLEAYYEVGVNFRCFIGWGNIDRLVATRRSSFPVSIRPRHGALGKYIVAHRSIDALHVAPLDRVVYFSNRKSAAVGSGGMCSVYSTTRALLPLPLPSEFNNDFLSSVAVTFSSLV